MQPLTRTRRLALALVACFGLTAAGPSACVSGPEVSDNPLLAGSGNRTRGTGGRPTVATGGSGASAARSGGGTGGSSTARSTGGALAAGGAGAAPSDGGSAGGGARVAAGGDGNQGGFILLAGATGIAAVDCPGAADVPPQPGSLRVQYRTSNTNDESDIAASFRIIKSELGNVAPEYTGPLYPEARDFMQNTTINAIVSEGVPVADALSEAQAYTEAQG